jgi:hypothetical protein
MGEMLDTYTALWEVLQTLRSSQSGAGGEESGGGLHSDLRLW